MSPRPVQTLLVLAALAVVILQGVAIVEQSLTMDEPYHLLAGVQIVEHGANTVNLEHPPLVKMVAALPWIGAELPTLGEPVPADRALAATQELLTTPRFRELALRSRALVTVCFALPFLLAAFWLGRQVADARTGIVLALGLGLAPAVLPYLPLLQTDGAVALGYCLCLGLGVSTLRRGPDLWNDPRVWSGRAAAMGATLGLALAVKFSGVLLVPAVVATALLAPLPATGPAAGTKGWLRRAAFVALAGVVSAVVLWCVYALADRADDDAEDLRSVELYATSRGSLIVEDRMEPWLPTLRRVSELSPEAGQWLTGLVGIRTQNAIGVYPSYALGAIDSNGRWWYFPVLFLARTPLVLLVALILGLVAVYRRCRPGRGPRAEPDGDDGPAWRVTALLAVTAGLYLALAVTSSYNIGFRHLLPVLPVLWLPAARWAARRDLRTAVVVGVLLVEAVALAPHWISSTNTWWLGSANPTRFAFGASDGDYEQGFRSLARAARERGIDRLHVIHPTASPAELGVDLPDAVKTNPFHRPLEPGWYAVTIRAEQLVPAILAAEPENLYNHPVYHQIAERWQPLLDEVAQRGEDHGVVAGVFRLYHVPPGGPASPQS